MKKGIAIALTITGALLIAGGVFAASYPNPFAFDGHSVLYCGSAIYPFGYSAGVNPACPSRRALMGTLALVCIAAGVVLIRTVVSKTRSNEPRGG